MTTNTHTRSAQIGQLDFNGIQTTEEINEIPMDKLIVLTVGRSFSRWLKSNSQAAQTVMMLLPLQICSQFCDKS